MRALVFVVLLAGCASSPPPHEDEVGDFIIAVRACVPRWFFELPTLDATSVNEVSVRVADGDFTGPMLTPYECVLAAGADCVRIRACYGLRSEATSGPCMGAAPRCDGDTLLLCVPAQDPSPTQIGRVDCTLSGQHCIEALVGATMTARCAVAACDGTRPPVRCDGPAIITCDGVFETRERGPIGTTCTESGGFAHFVGNGAPCTENECIGDVATVCDFETGRRSSNTDCASIGQSCSSSSFLHCVVEERECASTTVPTCTMLSTVSYCGADARVHAYDCVAHGFAGCEELILPEHPTPFASCAPVGARF